LNEIAFDLHALLLQFYKTIWA